MDTMQDKEIDPEIEKKAAPTVKTTTPRKRMLLWLTACILLVAFLWFLLWYFYLQYYESTDDAYVNGYMINITPVISGSPIAYYVNDTDFVEEGQLLVTLDDTKYKIEYEQALASLASTVLQVQQLYDNVKVHKANYESKKAFMSKLQFDFENRKNLIETYAVSNEDFIHARDDLTIAELAVKQAQSEFEAAKAAVGNTVIEEHPAIEEQKTLVRNAYFNLLHCNVYSPSRGHIAKRNVEVGQWVTPNTPMMVVIPQEGMWIDANFKETQLADMRIDQSATVTIDLYGSKKFKGKVIGISSGTGSVFSLIPPQNATGNWIKIVQRLPVRIQLDSDDLQHFPLRIGLSAYTTVEVSDTTLPKLAHTTSKKPIAKTKIFSLDFQEIEKTIDEIISKNMVIKTQIDRIKYDKKLSPRE